MRECPDCFKCYDDSVVKCTADGRWTFISLPGDLALEDKYVLERRLGEGGMGIVYKAHHKHLKTTSAIKIIRPELVGSNSSFATRFHQEAMAAARIRHPNIILVSDFGFLDKKIPFIVMEFIEGISLHDLMEKEGKFTPEKALEYIRVIASAVGAAHAHSIVHRDLKPLNIMITSQGNVSEQIRVLDFGLAKIKSAELFGSSFVGAQTTSIIGSPYYMSPEQWSEEETDKRCDVYSLGIILYQMLMGDVPFKGTSLPAIMKQHLMSAPPRMASSGITPQLEKVVLHALQKKPKLRTASTEDLVSELEQAILEPVAAPKAKTTKPRTTKPRTKTTATPRTKKKTGRLDAEPSNAETLRDSFEGSVPDEVSPPEPETVSQPATPEVVAAAVVSPKPPVPPTRSEPEFVRRPPAESPRKPWEPRAREVAEKREPVDDLPSFRQPKPPTLPGRVADGQQSIVGGLFRKRYRLLIAAGIVVVGFIVLLSAIYLRPESGSLTEGGEGPTTPSASRDMVLIEGGTFVMGSDTGDDQQKGLHSVPVESFYIDRNEVTNAEYAEFIKTTNRPAPALDESDPDAQGSYWQPWSGSDPPKGREQWPVCNVSAKDAEDYAQWLSNRHGVRYRLPTEEEWEFAARNGSKDTLFPWGNSWQEGFANLNGKSSPSDVGSFPKGATQAGVLDMIGNAWEWTSSKAKYYDQRPVRTAPNGRVRRGGSFAERINTDYRNATDRGWLGDEHYKFPTIGFRLARDRQ